MASKVSVVRPDGETVRLRVALADGDSEEALADALEGLVLATRDLKKLVRKAFYLVTTFHTPKHTFLRERAFFTRAVKHPALHDAMAAYARNVNSRKRGLVLETDLGHSDMRPAGCFAYVPLALHDPRFIELFIESMWGTDMDHETFHEALIEELLVRHGLCDETMRLLAFRAVDGQGQNGQANLQLAYEKHGLREKLAAPGGLEAFAKLVDEISERAKGPAKRGDGVPRHYRELYVSLAGKALFAGEEKKFRAWLDFFKKRGLKFDASESTPVARKPVRAPNDFASEWTAEDDE